MNISDMSDKLHSIINSLGGITVIISGFFNLLTIIVTNFLMERKKAYYTKELEELKSKLSQNVESYKMKLKNSEFIFQKELESASKFSQFKQSILPKHDNPEMDWEDVYEHIASQFSIIENILNNFIGLYGAILSDEIKWHINLSIYKAGSNKTHEINMLSNTKIINVAKEVYDHIECCEILLIEKVKSKSI